MSFSLSFADYIFIIALFMDNLLQSFHSAEQWASVCGRGGALHIPGLSNSARKINIADDTLPFSKEIIFFIYIRIFVSIFINKNTYFKKINTTLYKQGMFTIVNKPINGTVTLKIIFYIA